MLGWWITKCGNNGLQSVVVAGLQSVAKWITKWVRDYKVRQGLQSVVGLQSELVHSICMLKMSDDAITELLFTIFKKMLKMWSISG